MNRLRKMLIAVGITGFLLGAAVQWVIIWFVAGRVWPQVDFTLKHPAEVKWAMDRYNLVQKAATMLYFEDKNMDAVSVIRSDKVINVSK